MPNKKNKGFRQLKGSTTPSTRQSNHPAKRKQWSDKQAIDDVLSNQLKPLAAARLHGVPRSTLIDRSSGRVIPKLYLTAAGIGWTLS